MLELFFFKESNNVNVKMNPFVGGDWLRKKMLESYWKVVNVLIFKLLDIFLDYVMCIQF